MEILRNMWKLVLEEFSRLDNESKSGMKLSDWRQIDISPVDKYKQENGYECGIFNLLFISHHSQDLPHEFTQDAIIYKAFDGKGVRGKLAHLLWKSADPAI